MLSQGSPLNTAKMNSFCPMALMPSISLLTSLLSHVSNSILHIPRGDLISICIVQNGLLPPTAQNLPVFFHSTQNRTRTTDPFFQSPKYPAPTFQFFPEHSSSWSCVRVFVATGTSAWWALSDLSFECLPFFDILLIAQTRIAIPLDLIRIYNYSVFFSLLNIHLGYLLSVFLH